MMAGSVFVVVAPAAAGGGGCNEERTTGTGSEVRITNACFSPTVLRVDPGTEVTFVNGDEMLHAISGTGLDYDELSSGDRVARTFAASGIYPYMCHLHPGMSGAVVVGDGGDQVGSAVLASATEDDGPGPAVLVVVALAAASLGLLGGAFLQKKRSVART